VPKPSQRVKPHTQPPLELAGSNYIYTLAVVSIIYVRFTALILIFRQPMGRRITPLDGFIIRAFIQLGFSAVIGSLLPPQLALFGFRPTEIWQVSSGIIVVILGISVVRFPSRRHAASPIAIPPPTCGLLAVLRVMTLALLSNIVGPQGEIGVGIYSLGVIGILLAALCFYCSP